MNIPIMRSFRSEADGKSPLGNPPWIFGGNPLRVLGALRVNEHENCRFDNEFDKIFIWAFKKYEEIDYGLHLDLPKLLY